VVLQGACWLECKLHFYGALLEGNILQGLAVLANAFGGQLSSGFRFMLRAATANRWILPM
jgi:hypothetical protein